MYTRGHSQSTQGTQAPRSPGARSNDSQPAMTSPRQIVANRRNALLSTGPRSDDGKNRSRQNALTHGLAAESIVVGIEDAAAYEAFEADILAENEPQSTLERELALRVASLLWRLRRATLIDTGLLQISS